MSQPNYNANPPLRLLAAFNEVYSGETPHFIVQAPGRDMWVAALHTDAGAFTLHVPDLTSHTSFSWRSAKSKRTLLNRPLPRWARYPAGVVVSLCDNKIHVDGFDAVLVGNEREGPRRDFALGMAVAALLCAICETPYSDNELVDIVERVRRDYVEV